MRPYSVLVVDDEEFMRNICGRVLRGMGHEPVFAGTLAEALGKIGALDRLDLLITDLHLPDGHGIEAASCFHGKFPGAGMLVITAFLSLDTHIEEFQALGVSENDMLSKPFSVSALETAVKARLPGRGGPL